MVDLTTPSFQRKMKSMTSQWYAVLFMRQDALARRSQRLALAQHFGNYPELYLRVLKSYLRRMGNTYHLHGSTHIDSDGSNGLLPTLRFLVDRWGTGDQLEVVFDPYSSEVIAQPLWYTGMTPLKIHWDEVHDTLFPTIQERFLR